MTDLHTHILPGMDDGAQSIEEALELLQIQARQGVDTVALTPHFYGRRENAERFLSRREVAWKQLLSATAEIQAPRLMLGAEVAWVPDMFCWPELDSLCYQDTKILLVELPATPWSDSVFRELYRLESRRGIIPMIAHIDRYFYHQKDKDLDRLLGMGYPVQVSAEALLQFHTRRKALDLLKNYDGLLVSDCHNLLDRKPNIGRAMNILTKKMGQSVAETSASITDKILFI